MIGTATKSVDIEMEEFSDAATESTIESLLAKKIAVRVVVPASGRSSATDSTLAAMTAKGALIRTLATPEVHAKAIVIDAAHLYAGSINLTYSSIDRNREVGIITDNPAAVARVASTIASDFAKGSAL
ncbi:MAG: hypothetical protein NVS3B20_05880 [Polyangiales bacterium]